MAIFNGTQVDDLISGTSGDDIITGLAGNDVINGAAGDDQINGGADADDILGGAGDDTITVDSAADLQTGGNETIDGGDDTDTLVSGLLNGDILNGTGLWGTSATTSNLEFVQVSNASDFLLDLSGDAVFGSDTIVTSDDAFIPGPTQPVASGPVELNILAYTASNGEVNFSAADEDEKVIIDGIAYEAGETYTSPDGGSVLIGFVAFGLSVSGVDTWTFDYTPPEDALFAVGDAISATAADDDIITTVVATITNTDGTTVDVTVDLALNLDDSFDASDSSVGITTPGDGQDNVIIGSDFDDVFFAGNGGVDTGMDTISGGEGNDTIAGGDDDDTLYGNEGDDTIFAGTGDDSSYGNEGNDVIWSGDGDDYAEGGEDDDIIGGGLGSDVLFGDDGDDTIFAGSDDSIDFLYGGDGDDTIFAGDGDDFIYGSVFGGGPDGNDTLFNGAGNDLVTGGDGNDTLWGGAGNDSLTGGNSTTETDDDTFAFVAGNGNDTIIDFELEINVLSTTRTGTGDVLDLTAFASTFANTQAVIDEITDTGAGGFASLALAPGQTVEFAGLHASDFQSAFDDWVLV